jgi:general secretion pathway protein H
MNRRNAGFTLVEMLVVIVLIGLLASLVSLASGVSPATQARQDAASVIQLLQAGRQNALLEAREYGLRVETGTVQLMRLAPTGWHAVDKPLSLAPGFEWRLQSAGLFIDLQGMPVAPQILLLSSDELTPFALHLHDARQRWLSLSSDGLAEPQIEDPAP